MPFNILNGSRTLLNRIELETARVYSSQQVAACLTTSTKPFKSMVSRGLVERSNMATGTAAVLEWSFENVVSELCEENVVCPERVPVFFSHSGVHVFRLFPLFFDVS